MLSPFDSEMGHFFKPIRKFDEDFNTQKPQSETLFFSGENLEKWMLKTVCAFISANLIAEDGAKKECKLKDEYVDILFNNKAFPEGWGLYGYPVETMQYYHSISFSPLIGNGEVKAAEFLINNLMFYLLLGKPDTPGGFGIHHPMGIQFKQGPTMKTIEICWKSKQSGEGIFLNRVGTKPNEPNEWDDYLKK